MTVKVHVTRIFQKLGVQDRTSATAAALHQGIVSLDWQPDGGDGLA